MFTFVIVSCGLKIEKSGKNPANLVESGQLFQDCNPVPAKMFQIQSGFGQNDKIAQDGCK